MVPGFIVTVYTLEITGQSYLQCCVTLKDTCPVPFSTYLAHGSKCSLPLRWKCSVCRQTEIYLLDLEKDISS